MSTPSPGSCPVTPNGRAPHPPGPARGAAASSTPPESAGPVPRSISLQRSLSLPTFAEWNSQGAISEHAHSFVARSREVITNVLTGHDRRLLIVAGPCSLHNLGEAREFASKFRELQEETKDSLVLVMRAMFEKPRTSIGWKGLAHHAPGADELGMSEMLPELRNFFVECAEREVPLAAEALDPLLSLYLIDLLSYATIGARTSESQTHRQFGSMLKFPVGVKNPTSGDLRIAVDSVQAVASPQSAVFLDLNGAPVQGLSTGNPAAHLILRGGQKPNYDLESVEASTRLLKERGDATGRDLLGAMVIDCSHGNASGDYLRQPIVLQHCLDYLIGSESSRARGVRGFMMEANLQPGKQLYHSPHHDPGVSLTDACIGFDTLAAALRSAHERLATLRPAVG